MNEIKAGCVVTVWFNSNDCLGDIQGGQRGVEAVIIRIPRGAGDSWEFRTTDDAPTKFVVNPMSIMFAGITDTGKTVPVIEGA